MDAVVTLIIGVGGLAGAGKSTAASYLVDKYGARRYAFATPLKEIVRRTFDFSHAQVYGSQADKEADDPRYGFSPRWAMMRLGTEGIRSVLGAEFWAEFCLKQIAIDRPDVAVIEDVRFPNEAEKVHTAGGIVWRVERPGVVARTNHLSEQLAFTADEIITTSTIDELGAVLDFLFTKARP